MHAGHRTTLIALAAALAGWPASAQAPEQPRPEAAEAFPPPVSAVEVTPRGRGYTVERTPLAVLSNDPDARAILDEELPGLTTHPLFPDLRGGSITSLIPIAQGMITPNTLRIIQEKLDALP